MAAVRGRAGFTLVEVAVALAIGGVVLLVARQVFEAVTAGLTEVATARRSDDADANSHRLLSSLLGSIDTRSEGAGAFRGSPNVMECSAWYDREGARPMLRAIRLEAMNGRVGLQVGDHAHALSFPADRLELDYLLTPGAAESWARAWTSDNATPVAIRLRIRRAAAAETLLIYVGPRG
jgi:prepilin-type N-terminal cleavage/methylation domain-containing protein